MAAESAQQPPTRIHTTVPLPGKVRQIDILQILRAAAVIEVTWAHTSLFPNPHVQLPGLEIFGIDLFFVISGFIMCYIVLRTSDPPGEAVSKNFFVRRVIRIFPIYWIYALLGIVRYGHSHLITWRYLPSLFLLPMPQYPRIFGLSWTMMFEMFFYTSMAITLLFTVRHAVGALIAIFCGAALLGEALRSPVPFLHVALSPMLLEFVWGATIALLLDRFRQRRRLGIACFTAGTLLAVYLGAFPTTGANSMQMILAGESVLLRVLTWGMAAALLVAGAVFWSPAIRSKAGLLFVIIGNASYSIYLASTLVLEFTLRLLFKLVPPPAFVPLGRTLFYQVTLLLTVTLVGWASYQWLEWPLVRYLQRLVTGRRDPKPAEARA